MEKCRMQLIFIVRLPTVSGFIIPVYIQFQGIFLRTGWKMPRGSPLSIIAYMASGPGGSFSFSFGNTPAPATTPATFSFGNTSAPSTATPAAPSSFSFGNTPAASTTATQTPAPSFSFGTPAASTATQTPAPSFSFGDSTPATATTIPAFSFPPTATSAGSTTAPATSTTIPAASTTAPAASTATTPAASTFNLGSTPVAAATTASTIPSATVPSATAPSATAPSATGPSTTAPSATAPSATAPSTTAPSTTAPSTTAPPFAFGSSGAGTSAAASSTTTAATAPQFSFGSTATPAATGAGATKGKVDPAQSLKNKPLETIINEWSSDLNKHVQSFMKQAHQIREWDTMIAENGTKLIALHNQVQRVNLEQTELEHKLELIATKQNLLRDLLTNLEGIVHNLDNTGGKNQADQEREQGYQLAENINLQLDQMQKTLKNLVTRINEQQAPEEPEEPVAKLIDILNQHLIGLQWIDATTQDLNIKISEIEKYYY